MTAIGATSSMNKPDAVAPDEQEFLADRQPHRAQHHRLVKAVVMRASCSWRIPQRVAGEFQERVLEIGPMDAEFDHLVANLAGAADNVGHLVERMQGGRRCEPIDAPPTAVRRRPRSRWTIRGGSAFFVMISIRGSVPASAISSRSVPCATIFP